MASALPRLLFITPDETPDRVRHLVSEFWNGGGRLVQLRTPSLPAAQQLRLLHLLKAGSPPGALVLVNDRLDIAVIGKADGIHLKETSPFSTELTSHLPENAILFRATHDTTFHKTVEQGKHDLTAVTLSPVATPTSKRHFGAPLGLEQFSKFVQTTPIPVYALGGITPELAQQCRNHGAYGVAVIGGIAHAPNLTEATRRYLAALR